MSRSNSKAKQKVAVFFGGKSCEHEVSILTGLLAVKLLEKEYEVYPVYLSLENELFDGRGKRAVDYADFSTKGMKKIELDNGGLKLGRKRIKLDSSLNCCHGGLGEGGGLSALLAWNEIPSSSPNMTESALFQDKYLSKLAVRSLGVRVVEGLRFTERQYRRDGTKLFSIIEEKMEYPLIVKPNRLGSSVGIGVANDRRELIKLMDEGFTYDDSVLVEKFLREKRDINCAVYEGEKLVVSACEEVVSSDRILSFADKYEKKRNATLFEGEDAEEIKTMSARIYRRMAFQGVVRFDFIVSEDKIYFNELNTVPGSLAYYLFTPSLAGAKELFKSLIKKTNETHKKISTSSLMKQGDFLKKNSCKIR